MSRYVYIKDDAISLISDILLPQKVDSESDGLVYDSVIETDICGELCYEDGEIVERSIPEMSPEDIARNEIIAKAKRINAIEAEIRSLGSVETTSTFLQTVNASRIEQLRTEKENLEEFLDEEAADMEPGVFDTIISAIFS